MKRLRKFVTILLAAGLMTSVLAGCASKAPADEKKTYKLTVSGIGGSLNYIPVYIAEQEGWLKDANLEIEEIMFTNGPVQMESLSSNSWDLGFTGVGGVLSGVIGYDALVVGASNTDDGTQYVFARNDSEIVKAGSGNSEISDKIFGDAESWKGKEILCNTGTVLQYLLIKTLSGYGLKPDDVTFIAMDAPTAYSAFLAGQGDVAVLTGSSGTFNMLKDSANYTAVSSGTWADTGLMCNFVANKNSYADAEKYEAMKILLGVYFKSLDWMKENPDKAAEYMVDFSEENGIKMDAETAKVYMQADKYYTLEEAYQMITTKAENSEVTVMEKKLADVLDFFIAYGKYKSTDAEVFKGNADAKLMKDVYEASKK